MKCPDILKINLPLFFCYTRYACYSSPTKYQEPSWKTLYNLSLKYDEGLNRIIDVFSYKCFLLNLNETLCQGFAILKILQNYSSIFIKKFSNYEHKKFVVGKLYIPKKLIFLNPL